MGAATLLRVSDLCIHTLEGRALARDLNLSLGRERVAVVGRNGVGKTSLIRVLAGRQAPTTGTVHRYGSVALVDQDLDQGESSGGERRRAAIERALERCPELLILDEPSEDLDEVGRRWLGHRLRAWRGGLIVVSHDPDLLRSFGDFFVVEESGCHHFSGSFDGLQEVLRSTELARQARYLRRLESLRQDEARHQRVRQRRQRKKAVGRLHELDRCQSRVRLNTRRGLAQVSQGRVDSIAAARIADRRAWARATRRAMRVSLPLELVVPELPATGDSEIVGLRGVELVRGGRVLFSGVNRSIGRDRIAVTGPNGSGKSSLLQLMLGELSPTSGAVRTRLERVGFIDQGAENWKLDASLRDHLSRTLELDSVASVLVAHRFPLALAERSMASLSPGERTRAALIALFQRPGLELLVLDEPTRSLDLLGVSALAEALGLWSGGLVIASHDRAFLEALGLSAGAWTLESQ